MEEESCLGLSQTHFAEEALHKYNMINIAFRLLVNQQNLSTEAEILIGWSFSLSFLEGIGFFVPLHWD